MGQALGKPSLPPINLPKDWLFPTSTADYPQVLNGPLFNLHLSLTTPLFQRGSLSLSLVIGTRGYVRTFGNPTIHTFFVPQNITNIMYIYMLVISFSYCYSGAADTHTRTSADDKCLPGSKGPNCLFVLFIQKMIPTSEQKKTTSPGRREGYMQLIQK